MSDARDVAQRLRKSRRCEKVTTDEGTIYVRGLSGAERQLYMDKFSDTAEPQLPRLLADQHLVAMALCDEKAQPLFDAEDAERNFADSLEAVCDWDISIVTDAAKKVCDLSGLSKLSTDAAEKK